MPKNVTTSLSYNHLSAMLEEIHLTQKNEEEEKLVYEVELHNEMFGKFVKFIKLFKT